LHQLEARGAKLRRRCRKPEIGLLEMAASELHVSLTECHMIGDGIPDLLAGAPAGCRTTFIGRWKCEICQFTGAPNTHPAFVADSLWQAAQLIRAEITAARPIASFRQ
jgi:D-glycero-D-manno-heptose 1,7-bisphosphate phosphatase